VRDDERKHSFVAYTTKNLPHFTDVVVLIESGKTKEKERERKNKADYIK